MPPPWISPPLPNLTTDEDVALSYDLTPHENDKEDEGVNLIWSLSDVDTSIYLAEINEKEDLLTINPIPNAHGTDEVTLTLTDSGGLISSQGINVIINPINDAPVLVSIGDKQVDEGKLLEFTITATDPDVGTLTYSASNLPKGTSFNPSTQVFTWTPDYTQVGVYKDVHFEVSDGKLTDSEDIAITVKDVNQIPIATIYRIWPNPAYQGQRVYFSGYGQDKDGYITEYHWHSSIDGFLSSRSSFSTTKLSPGTHTIYFKVKDDKGAWSEEATQRVNIY